MSSRSNSKLTPEFTTSLISRSPRYSTPNSSPKSTRTFIPTSISTSESCSPVVGSSGSQRSTQPSDSTHPSDSPWQTQSNSGDSCQSFRPPETCDRLRIPREHLLAVRILIQEDDQPNPDWQRIFTREHGFAPPKFVKTQYPNETWLNQKNGLTEVERIQLYNQYLIWIESIDIHQPIVVIYNRCYPVESDQITAELVKAGQKMSDQDIVYYGKYLDRCDKYQYDRTVIISNDDTIYKFPIYRTFSPYGLFAYLIFPSGAQKLVRAATLCPDTPEEVANRAIDQGSLKAVVYHPSIIRISDPHHEMFGYECREPEIGPDTCTWGQWFWYIVVVIFLAIVIAAIIYFLAANIIYSPDQRINCGYQLCPSFMNHSPPLTNPID